MNGHRLVGRVAVRFFFHGRIIVPPIHGESGLQETDRGQTNPRVTFSRQKSWVVSSNRRPIPCRRTVDDTLIPRGSASSYFSACWMPTIPTT